MSKLHVNAIVTRALLDQDFRAALLNGQRRARLAAFELTRQERDAILGIQTQDLDEFIRQLHAWMRPARRPSPNAWTDPFAGIQGPAQARLEALTAQGP